MMNARLYVALLALLSAANVTAQRPSEKTTSPPTAIDVCLSDGSVIRGTITKEKLEVMTKYGKLIIPVSDVRRIDFGLHIAPEVAKDIERG